MLVLAYWLVRWQGRLWRRAIWAESGEALQRLAGTLGGEVRPGWMGWRVQGPRVRIAVWGSLQGIRTQVRLGGRVVLQGEAPLQVEEVLRAVRDQGEIA